MAVANLSSITEERTPNRLYKLAPTSVGLDSEAAVAVDERLMSATAIISTPTPDRVKDILIPTGCKLDNYRKNPVVLWDHGFSLSLPIAKSVDPAGKLTVALSDASVVATSYFTNRLLESEQIFTLIAEGIIKATSVRACPIGDFRRDADGYGMVMDEWDLEEWSWVAVGCNPEAVTGVVAKNRLCERPISESILKSLSVFDLPKKIQVPGVTLKGKTMAKKIAKSKVKADPPEDELPEEETPETEPTSEEEMPVDDSPETDSPSPAEMKLGAQMLSAAHAGLSDLSASVKAGMEMLENQEVQAALGNFLSSCDEKLAEIEGVYSSTYGGTLKAETPEGEPDEAEVVKSFLANASGSRYQLAGLGGRLKSLTAAKNLTADQRRTIAGVVKHFGDLVSKAKSHKPAESAAPASPASAQADLDKLRTQFESLTKKLRAVMPASG